MIEPAQFLLAMADPEAAVLRFNASAIILEHLGRMNYPVEAQLNVPVAALQGRPIVPGGAIDSVRMIINVEGNVPKPALRTVRGGPTAQGADCIINEMVILRMTDAGTAVAVMIAAYGEAAIARVDARVPETSGRISVSLRNLLWQWVPNWLRRRLRDR